VATRSWRWVTDCDLTAITSWALRYHETAGGLFLQAAHGTSLLLVACSRSAFQANLLPAVELSRVEGAISLSLSLVPTFFVTKSHLSRGRDTRGVEWPSSLIRLRVGMSVAYCIVSCQLSLIAHTENPTPPCSGSAGETAREAVPRGLDSPTPSGRLSPISDYRMLLINTALNPQLRSLCTEQEIAPFERRHFSDHQRLD
jgi:hypothetical protein